MGILDIVLLLCFVPAIVSGLQKGFIQELISTISIVLGAWLAFQLYPTVAAFIAPHSGMDPKAIDAIAFLVVVLTVIAALSFAGSLLTKIFRMVALGWLNRLMGLVFGIIRTALLLGVLVMAFEGINDKLGLVKSATTEGSVVYNAIKDFAEAFFPYLKTLISSGADAATIDV